MSLFEDLDRNEAVSARGRFERREVEAGAVLVGQGEPGEGLFIVESGQLRVSADAVEVGSLGPGDTFGETALFDDRFAIATVAATSPCVLLMLDRAGFNALVDQRNTVADRIERLTLDHQVRRVIGMGKRIAELARGTPSATTTPGASFFASVSAQFGRGGRFSFDCPDARSALRKSIIFQDNSPEILEAIANELLFEADAPGTVLCRQGEIGDSMYLVDEGEVDVVVASTDQAIHPLVRLGPGDAFGMVSLASDGPRMSSCIARTRVVVHRLDRPGWDHLLADREPPGRAFRRAMIRALTDQLQASNARLSRGTPGALDDASASIEAYGSHVRQP
jgi:CRP/FNR family cyclic AMP-dependent transcriptional regulator